MNQCTLVLIAAISIDYIIGDPRYPYHPVRLTGQCISFFEGILYRSDKRGLFNGFILVLSVIGVTAGTGYLLHFISGLIHPWLQIVFHIGIVYSCIAYRDLVKHCTEVYLALECGNIQKSRNALAMIVGRDVNRLDESDIGRATIETLAENYVDGFLAPVFWFVFGCILGTYFSSETALWGVLSIILYRTANTLDSMVGYNNDRYLYFGRAGAHLDDVMNFIPARLSVFFIVAGSILSGNSPLACVQTAIRDRMNHASPNAGHPESCAAGALGVRLGGPVLYPYGLVQKKWMGDGRKEISANDVRKGMVLIKHSYLISVFITVVIVHIALKLF